MTIRKSPVHSESHFTWKTIVTDIAKYYLFGLMMSAAFFGLYLFFGVMTINIQFGNRLPFVPLVLVLCTPLVLILIGELNRTAAKRFWKYEINSHWASLLGLGIVLSLVVYYSTLFIGTLMANYLLIRVAGYMGGFILVPHSIIIMPVVGFFCKIINNQIKYEDRG